MQAIGERVAFYRRRRGMTQVVLAGRVGRTTSWVEKIESGRANLDRISVAQIVADVLGVPLALLLADERPDHVVVPRLETLRYEAINPRLLRVSLASEAEQLTLVDDVWSAYQAGRFNYAIRRLNTALPSVFRRATTQTARASDRAALALLYHAAASIMTKIGNHSAARVCAERGEQLAAESGDRPTILSLQRSIAHTLLATGEASTAVEVASNSISFAGIPRSDVDRSVIGSLAFVGAIAAARSGDRTEAMGFLQHADKLASDVGEGKNWAWTAFGPANVQIHRIAVGAELGDPPDVFDADSMSTEGLPAERRVRHHLDVARILTSTGQADGAMQRLLEADRIAPEHLSTHFITHGVVQEWMRTLRTRPNPDMLALVRRLGHAL